MLEMLRGLKELGADGEDPVDAAGIRVERLLRVGDSLYLEGESSP